MGGDTAAALRRRAYRARHTRQAALRWWSGLLLLASLLMACQRLTSTPPADWLGTSRGTWERAHGAPEEAGAFTAYDQGLYQVVFAPTDTFPRVVFVRYTWGERAPVDLATARARVAQLLPPDAHFVGTLTPQAADGAAPEALLVIYSSDTLQRLLPRSDQQFLRNRPGFISVAYTFHQELVTEVTISSGANALPEAR
jgi:hypothetical protein